MATDNDFYELLGVSSDASPEEIKRAYRRLARQHHPDVNPGDPDAAERFKQINEAYEVLRDPERRSIYDRYGAEGLRAGAASGAGFTGDFGGFGDLFEAFFGGGVRQEQRTGPQRGDDLRYDLEITLEEAAFGTEKKFRVGRMSVCDDCKGTGSADSSQPGQCPQCRGTGQVRHQQNTILGSFATVTTCGTCRGEGFVVRNPCRKCHGEGRSRSQEEITLTIPPGVDTGSRMRVPNKGNAGRRGGPAGDYYIILHVKSHSRYRRQGDDLMTEVPVGIAQAALGSKINIKTLWGEEELDVASGTQSGETFQIRGQGMPSLNGRGRGDLYVTLRVVVPTDLTSEQRELLRRFSELRGEETEMERSFFEKMKDHFTGR